MVRIASCEQISESVERAEYEKGLWDIKKIVVGGDITQEAVRRLESQRVIHIRLSEDNNSFAVLASHLRT